MKTSSLVRRLSALGVVIVASGTAVAGASAPPSAPPGSGAGAPGPALPPPPGELYDVDGHAMHLYCTGDGSPTVILDAGLGDAAIGLFPMQERIAEHTRVCSFDRPGYGWSESGPEPRTSQQIVDELATLLDTAGEAGPYVLAGHSFGGLDMILYAAEHPDDVVGVVLIDSSHPDQTEALAAVPELLAVQDAEIAGIADLLPAAESGQLTAADVLGSAPDLPGDLRETWAELFVQPSSIAATVAEYAALDESMEEVAAAGSLGDIPLVVLAHGRSLADILPAEAREQLGLTDEVLADYEDIWRELQTDHLARSSDSVLIVAPDSGHYIYRDQPDLVVDAISALVAGELPSSVPPTT